MAEAPSRIGSVIADKYRLDAELGRGGMGAVYRARHERVAKDFAVKILHAELASSAEASARFFKEAQAAGRIGHPAILEVYDVGELEDGSAYMVMELLHGAALSTTLRRGRFEIDQALFVAMEVLDALAAAHAAGVVHRDVKPQNIFLTKGEGGARAVKLLDFGIAKFQSSEASALTHTGKIMGSPLYMAPEQAKAEVAVDARADVWSVGATLFEMLTGSPAYIAGSAVAVLAKILTEPAPPPSSRRKDLPPEIDAVVAKAMAFDREDRYADARAMRDALREVSRTLGLDPDAPPPSLPTVPDPVAEGLASTHEITASLDSEGVAPPPSPRETPAKITPAKITPARITPAPSDASRPSSPASRSSEEPEGAAVTHHEVPSKRSPWMYAALAVIAAAVAVPLALDRGGKAPADAPPPPSATGLASAAIAPTPAAPSASMRTDPAPSASVRTDPAPSASMRTDPAPSASMRTDPAARAVSSARAPEKPAPKASSRPAASSPAPCAAGEVRSEGHCCPRGFEWRNGRCDRPVAKTF